MDDGVGAGLGTRREKHREAHPPAEQAGLALAEIRRDESGMQAIGGDAGAGEPPGELAGEQDVAQLGAGIGKRRPVAVLGLQVGEIERGPQMRVGGRVDDARWRRRNEAFAQSSA